jgi:DNA-binding NarL/FixJ family response regulator
MPSHLTSAHAPPGQPGGELAEWPLIGRSEELDFLRTARRRRPPASIVVSGLPGVGKSRLAATALSQAQSEGWGVVYLRSSKGLKSVAFAPFRTVVPVPPSSDLGEVVAGLEDALAARRGARGLLLSIDDAHDLDDASAGFVHHVVVTGLAVAMLTLRSGTERPDALTALWKDGHAERVELQGLSRPETGELATAALGSQVEEATIQRLWQLTDGNPLYLREVLLSAHESGILQSRSGVWRWRGEFTTGVRLREIVAERLGRLEPDELTAVELLSVARSLPVDLLTSLSGATSVERLESRALVYVERSGRRVDVCLAHPLYGEVVRAGMPALRAQSTRRRLAIALQRAGARRSADRVNLAWWSLDAGIATDPVALSQAADAVLWHQGQEISDHLEEILTGTVLPSRPQDRSEGRGDAGLAVRLARAAYDSSHTMAAGATLAETLCWAGEVAEASRVLAELQANTPTGDDHVRLAMALAEVMFWGEHRHADAIKVLTEAAAAASADTDRALLAELTGKLAGIELNTDRPLDALAHAKQAAELSGEELVASFAAPAAAASLSHLGRCTEAIDLIDRAIPLAMERGRHSMEVPQLLFTKAGTLGRAGRLEEAGDLASNCHQVALSIDSLEGTGLFGISAAETLLRQGRPASAARLFREAIGLLEERDVFGYLRWALAGLARARALIGDEEGASRALARADVAAEGERYFDVWRFDAAAAVHALAGREIEALEAARLGAGWARGAGMPVEESMLLHRMMRISRPPAAAERLQEVAEVTDSAFVGLLAENAAALVSNDPAALTNLSQRLAACSARFMAAEAAAAAAAIYERRHESRAALTASRLAVGHLEHCEGARSPLVDRLVMPALLTRRELQVATLAAGGHSSGEIAARLHLSARTVDSHLYRTYIKLGVTSRADLSAALGDHDRRQI